MLSQLHLMHLLSPALPVGSYSYSQGLEWAVEKKWITNETEFECWINELIFGQLAQQDLPLLRNLRRAAACNDVFVFNYWSDMALAMRDTAELRAEERSRAEAYHRVLKALPGVIDDQYLDGIKRSPLAAVAWASARWDIEEQSLLSTYALRWLEAYIVNGVKIIPLGQTQGQSMLHSMLPALHNAVNQSILIEDSDIGFTAPAMSIASCGHETQYTRIYRS